MNTPTAPTCDCGSPYMTITSHSAKNPNRDFFKCEPCNAFKGWVDEAQNNETTYSNPRKRPFNQVSNTSQPGKEEELCRIVQRIYDLLDERLPMPQQKQLTATPAPKIPTFAQLMKERNERALNELE